MPENLLILSCPNKQRFFLFFFSVFFYPLTCLDPVLHYISRAAFTDRFQCTGGVSRRSVYSSKGVSAINHSEAAALSKVTELCSARPKPCLADWREESTDIVLVTLFSTAVETAIAQCTSRWAMARGNRLNTSIVLAAVHGLSGLFRTVSAVEPSLSRPLPTLSPSLIGHLASVDVKQHERKRRAC